MSLPLRISLPVVVVLALAALMFLPAAHADAGQWVKYSGNPVLVPVLGPTSGGWDSAYTLSPRVLYDSSGYRMWFNGGNTTFAAIGYATSSDGVAWSTRSSPVLVPGSQGSWDSNSVSLGNVLWNGTMYLMYYRGTNPTTYENGAIGLATSKDGVAWSKFKGNPIIWPTPLGADQGYIASPFVVKQELSYDMWYTAKNVTYAKISPYTRILFATSLDGVHWAKWPSPVFSPASDSKAWDSGAVYSPSVYFNGTAFGLWYTAFSQSQLTPQIGVATSPDGSTWTRSSYNPILSPGAAGSWDSAGVEQPNAVVGGRGVMLYYDGVGSSSGARIGLAQPPQGPQIYPIPEFPYVNLLIPAITLISIGLLRQRKH